MGLGDYTHPYLPWGAPAGPIAAGTPVAPIAGMNIHISWPQPSASGGPSFNAIHMALIPKGPYRGHVLVFGILPAVIKNPTWAPTLPANEFQSFQPYAIIDPADVPLGGIRYRNFLLPLGSFDPGAHPGGIDFFCSGHTWTQFGDLVVIGGTDYDVNVVPFAQAGKMTYSFNPRRGIADFPGTPTTVGGQTNPYPGFSGRWLRGPDLASTRWYPTAVRTLRLPRLQDPQNPLGKETVLAVGGTTDTSNYTTPGPNPTWNTTANPTWNSYEALVIQAEASAISSTHPGFATDQIAQPPALPIRQWPGPGTYIGPTPQVDVDWFEEYARCQSLSTRQVAVTGYAPRWALVDHEFPGVWSRSNGQPAGSSTYSATWQDVRHDGSSVLFPNIGGQLDVILRIGGSNQHWWWTAPPLVYTTETVESVQLDNNAAEWQEARAMPTTHPPGSLRDGGRFLANAVILPTGGILVVGGVHCNGPFSSNAYVYKPQIFEAGDWHTYDANPTLSPRDYHSTAVLLPDGRVFVGGGNGRLHDYEIFSPPYLGKPSQRPTGVTWQAPVPTTHPDLGAFELAYDETRVIQCNPMAVGHAIEKIVFIAPGSVTHHSDMHQRYFEVRANVQGGNVATFTTPASEAELPRGIYMMFLVTNLPTVSHAEWVVFL